MARTVFCRKHQQELEGLAEPPFPGSIGEDIFNHVSKKAWEQWQQQQTMLINEKQLTLTDPEARRYLKEQMQKFFSGEAHDTAEGYVPPE
jgi:Fe-S cluster biosynthesis and repair protein YggX